MWVRSIDWEDPLEDGVTTHFNVLAWRIPWTEEQRVRHNRGDLAHMHANF